MAAVPCLLLPPTPALQSAQAGGCLRSCEERTGFSSAHLACGCCSVTRLCLTLCDAMDCSMSSFCPSLSPGVYSDSCPLCQWCYLTISSSATPFSFCPQSFPASGSFLMSWLFASDGQRIGASASVLPVNSSCEPTLSKNREPLQCSCDSGDQVGDLTLQSTGRDSGTNQRI